jgi:hypothetical protein
VRKVCVMNRAKQDKLGTMRLQGPVSCSRRVIGKINNSQGNQILVHTSPISQPTISIIRRCGFFWRPTAAALRDYAK